MSNYDVVIDRTNKRFYFKETSENQDAVASLTKIETIMKENFAYHSANANDEYLSKTRDEMFAILEGKATQISLEYKSQFNWLTRFLFSKEKEVNAFLLKIRSYVRPSFLGSTFGTLPLEISERIIGHLDVKGITKLKMLNRDGNDEGKFAVARRANELYHKGNEGAETNKYLKNLFRETDELTKRKVIIPERCIVKNNAEATLKNMQKMLSSEEIFKILADRNLKKWFPTFHKFFIELVKEHLKNTPKEELRINATNDYQETALLVATRSGDLDVCRLLLEYGADPNQPWITSPLVEAVNKGDIAAVKLLLTHHANPNIQDTNRLSILQVAFDLKYLDIAEALLKKRANANVQEGYSWNITLLHHLIRHHSTEAVSLLIKYGADINSRTYFGLTTPVMMALQEGKKAIVYKLVQEGADLTLQDRLGKTALHYVGMFQSDLRRHLVAQGAI